MAWKEFFTLLIVFAIIKKQWELFNISQKEIDHSNTKVKQHEEPMAQHRPTRDKDTFRTNIFAEQKDEDVRFKDVSRGQFHKHLRWKLNVTEKFFE